ncbi:MAG TPA: LysE family transporter, partial [Dermatophilaceae bacterium]|nr:LysE family transporter [Dermatophilaceae bacterium]
MAASSVLAFWALAALLIVVPGADWAFTLSVAARGQSALPAVGGLAIGYLGMTGVVAAGVGALVSRTPSALTALSVTGGLYLIWHGAMTFVQTSAQGSPSTDSSTGWVMLVKG